MPCASPPSNPQLIHPCLKVNFVNFMIKKRMELQPNSGADGSNSNRLREEINRAPKFLVRSSSQRWEEEGRGDLGPLRLERGVEGSLKGE